MPIKEFNSEIHQKQEGKRYWANKNYVNNFMFIAKN